MDRRQSDGSFGDEFRQAAGAVRESWAQEKRRAADPMAAARRIVLPAADSRSAQVAAANRVTYLRTPNEEPPEKALILIDCGGQLLQLLP